MEQAVDSLTVQAPERGMMEVTAELQGWLDGQTITDGLLTVFIQHTSASILVQENVSPQVLRDMAAFLDRLVPDGDPLYGHTEEGADDMPAHVKGALTQSDLALPVEAGRLALGRYQGVFLFEHRTATRPRTLKLHLLGERR